MLTCTRGEIDKLVAAVYAEGFRAGRVRANFRREDIPNSDDFLTAIGIEHVTDVAFDPKKPPYWLK